MDAGLNEFIAEDAEQFAKEVVQGMTEDDARKWLGGDCDPAGLTWEVMTPEGEHADGWRLWLQSGHTVADFSDMVEDAIMDRFAGLACEGEAATHEVKCDFCKGRGWFVFPPPSDFAQKCDACDGTGRVRP